MCVARCLRLLLNGVVCVVCRCCLFVVVCWCCLVLSLFNAVGGPCCSSLSFVVGVCCLECVVCCRCLLFVAVWWLLLCAVCFLLFDLVGCLMLCLRLPVVRCLMAVVRCSLFVVCCNLLFVCCGVLLLCVNADGVWCWLLVLFVDRCMSSVACYCGVLVAACLVCCELFGVVGCCVLLFVVCCCVLLCAGVCQCSLWMCVVCRCTSLFVVCWLFAVRCSSLYIVCCMSLFVAVVR